MKDLYTKHLQKYKYLDQKEIKKDIFKLFSKIDCGDELSKNWLYLTLLIIAFLNHEHENDGLELANIINSKFN